MTGDWEQPRVPMRFQLHGLNVKTDVIFIRAVDDGYEVITSSGVRHRPKSGYLWVLGEDGWR